MPIAIVDLPERIDVNEGEHQPAATAAGAVDLSLEGVVSESPAVGPGELVEVSCPQLRKGVLSLEAGLLAVQSRLSSIVRRSVALLGGTGANLRSVPKGLGEGSRSGRHLSLEPERLVISSIRSAVAGLSGQVAMPGALVTPRRDPGSLL